MMIIVRMFKFIFKGKVIEFEEEFKLPEPAEIATLESWVHVPPNILKMGRVSHWVGGNLPEEVRQ